jgi:hypothetical protein
MRIRFASKKIFSHQHLHIALTAMATVYTGKKYGMNFVTLGCSVLGLRQETDAYSKVNVCRQVRGPMYYPCKSSGYDRSHCLAAEPGGWARPI